MRYSPDGDCILAFDVVERTRRLPRDRGHVDRVDGVAALETEAGVEAFTSSSDGTIKRWSIPRRSSDECLALDRPKRVDQVTVVPTERLEANARSRVLSVSEDPFDGAGGFVRLASLDDSVAVRDLRAEFYRDRDRGLVMETGLCARLSLDGSTLFRVLSGYRRGQPFVGFALEPVAQGGVARRLVTEPTEPDGAFVASAWLDAARVVVFMQRSTMIVDVSEDTLVAPYEHASWDAGTVACALSETECVVFDWQGSLTRRSLSTDEQLATTKTRVPYVYPLRVPTLAVSDDRSLVLVTSRAGARVYDARTLSLVAKLRFAKAAGRATSLAFVGDSRVIVGCKRGVALVYALDRR